MSTPSKQRRKAIEQYVDSWVSYAFSSDDHENPFEKSDKRHDMFAKKLNYTMNVDAQFHEIDAVYGGHPSMYTKHQYPKPVMVDIDDLGPARVVPQNRQAPSTAA